MGFRRRGRGWRPPSSIQQNRLIHHVRLGGYPQAQLNWPIPIRGQRKKRWADVAIVNLKVAIEYDGPTHFTLEGKRRDKMRNAELNAMGWRVIHVSKYNWQKFFSQLKAYIDGDLDLVA
jgi:very-short-patch-repair endonuclease